MRLVIFGYGFSGRTLARRLRAEGWDVVGVCRDVGGEARIRSDGARAVRVTDTADLAAAVCGADAVLVTAPPGAAGCPGLAALEPAMRTKPPDWIGYLSTTGVYGDRRGGWVTERSRLAAQSVEAARRVGAERDWKDLGARLERPVAVFRLPGIYGPGRSALDRLRAGTARRIVAPGQVFSRIHVEDLAAGVAAAVRRRAAGAYNLCDDEPAPNSDVIAYAAGLLKIPPPQEEPLADANQRPAALRFYAESKRVSNALAKAALGWRPAYPTYREGLRAMLEHDPVG